jgi:hypothetical protein
MKIYFFLLLILFNCKKFSEIKFQNGDKYVGTVSNHKPNGNGVYTSSEFIYKGDFHDGKRQGHGIQTWTNGIHESEEYIGEWREDMRDGNGIHSWPDGRKYNGEWKSNRQNGKGMLSNSNGDSYMGMFKDDLPEGEGTKLDPKGNIVYQGKWSKGNPIK